MYMTHGSTRGIPFAERGGRLRGVLDLVSGRYPLFVFGGPLGTLVPVFHLHEVTPAWLEPQLQFLAENRYRTAQADELAQYVTRGLRLPSRTVALTFDDARASLWTVAAPLLRKYGFSAITFASPARIHDATTVRPTLADGIEHPEAADASRLPFVSWPELRALHMSGTIDIQAHTLTHSAIFCSDEPVGFVTPAFSAEPILNRPLVSLDGRPQFLTEDELGSPLYVRRSRMSDATRFLVRPDLVERTTRHVSEQGGAAFFKRAGWEAELRGLMPQRQGVFERADSKARAIEDELDRCASELNGRLRTNTVRHIALPWGIAGQTTRDALRRSVYTTAYLEEMFGRQGVRPGDDRHRLMRLNGKYIQCLPGRGRKFFTSRV